MTNQGTGKKYETVVIYGNELTEARVKEEIQNIENFLKGKGVSVEVNRWGLKQLAFSIKKRKNGQYVTFSYETEDSSIPSALSTFIRLGDVAIRYQTHRLGLPTRKIKARPGQNEGEDDFDDEFAERSY